MLKKLIKPIKLIKLIKLVKVNWLLFKLGDEIRGAISNILQQAKVMGLHEFQSRLVNKPLPVAEIGGFKIVLFITLTPQKPGLFMFRVKSAEVSGVKIYFWAGVMDED